MVKVISVSVSLAVGDDETTGVQRIKQFTRTSDVMHRGLDAFNQCVKAVQSIEAGDIEGEVTVNAWDYFRGVKSNE